jgi:hypothetical protein
MDAALNNALYAFQRDLSVEPSGLHLYKVDFSEPPTWRW